MSDEWGSIEPVIRCIWRILTFQIFDCPVWMHLIFFGVMYSFYRMGKEDSKINTHDDFLKYTEGELNILKKYENGKDVENK